MSAQTGCGLRIDLWHTVVIYVLMINHKLGQIEFSMKKSDEDYLNNYITGNSYFLFVNIDSNKTLFVADNFFCDRKPSNTQIC